MASAKRTGVRVFVHDHLAEERWLPHPTLRYRKDETIFLDGPAPDEKTKRECYGVLARIPWLHEKIRTAIRRHGLNENVQQADNINAKLTNKLYRDEITRYEKAGSKAPYKELAARIGISVGALKRRLGSDRMK